MDVASRLFAERGYAGTSLNEIIRATRFTKGAFYFHFPSKEALVLEVLRYKADEWTDGVMSTGAPDARAIDQIRAMAMAMGDLHEQDDPTMRAIHRLLAEASDDPALMPHIAAVLTTWVDMIAALIRRAQEEGDVRGDVDPVAAAEAVVAGFIGMEQLSRAASGGADMRRRVESFFGLFLAALRTEGGDRGDTLRRRSRRQTPGGSKATRGSRGGTTS